MEEFYRNSQLRHRIQLCTQKDVITSSDGLKLRREAVLSMWAHIEERDGSTFNVEGAAFREFRNKRTHMIITRYRHDINVSAMAWIYEKRLKSAPRWFKIVSYAQTENRGFSFFLFDCRLVERGDDIAEPREDSFNPVLQQNVKL